MLTRLAHDEGGFTITELLVAMVIGIVVLFAAFQIIDSSLAYPVKIQNRTDAYQRGRLTMDIVAAQLRSQVCLPSATATPPIIPTSSTANDVWFYNNTGDQNAQPSMRHIYLSSGSLLMQTYPGVAPVPPSTTPTFPSSTTRTLLTNVGLYNSTPLFQYYGFDSNSPANVDSSALSVPISSTNAARIVDIAVSFRVHPTGQTADKSVDSIFQQSVFVRTADPTDPAKGPKCQ